jgi:uncharacterized protein
MLPTPADRKSAVVLLLAPLLLTTFKYYGSTAFYLAHLGGLMERGQVTREAAELYHFVAAFVLLGLIPALVLKFLLREPLAAYGVQRGDTRFGLKAVLIMLPILVVAAYPNARSPEFTAEYPFNPQAGRSPAAFGFHAATYLLYYAGWEFFFRGFMQFGLRDRLGDWNAILVQTLASCLVHIGKPAGEIYGSIAAGVVWGLVVFRARSLWPVLLTHWALGVSLDYFICFSGKGG